MLSWWIIGKLLIHHTTYCRVADMGVVNKMTAQNLAIVFGPTLLVSDSNKDSQLTDMGDQYRLVEAMVNNFHAIFEVEEASSALATLTAGMDPKTAARMQDALRKIEEAQKNLQMSKSVRYTTVLQLPCLTTSLVFWSGCNEDLGTVHQHGSPRGKPASSNNPCSC
jgi:hypothetical protein